VRGPSFCGDLGGVSKISKKCGQVSAGIVGGGVSRVSKKCKFWTFI